MTSRGVRTFESVACQFPCPAQTQEERGFGVKILGYDLYHNPEFTELGGKYVELDTLFSEADIISLHCPLTPQTFHLIDAQSIAKMKRGVMIINTSRGTCRCQLIKVRSVR